MLALALLSLLSASDLKAPAPFVAGPSVEGISEFRLPNGLKLVLVPDDSKDLLFINVVVMVGSRHEGYGEAGMAHLLEHMLFKGTPTTPQVDKTMTAHGAQNNATTAEDRTNYFEWMPATDANLEWALRFEADRLVNTPIKAKELATEMTVVRNEFERGENEPEMVLEERLRSAAYMWHAYGRSVIGNRSDIERVPAENLEAFYKKYYQPDNVMLVVAGKFNPSKLFAVVSDSFGKLKKPARSLPATFTEEPIQDGERTMTMRRVGGVPLLAAGWHTPSPRDPDFPALMLLQGVLGDAPQGRLHVALVDGKKAAQAGCGIDEHAEPGLLSCTVKLGPKDNVAEAKKLLLATIEDAVKKPITKDEFERARVGWLSQLEQSLQSSEAVGFLLTEYGSMGDWRLVFVLRDALKKVALEDLNRVAAKYLKPDNRTLVEYVPVEKPDRAAVAPQPKVASLVDGYKGGEALAKGEVFDASPSNIEKRTHRSKLSNGAQVALLPKKTRGETVVVNLVLHYGTAESLAGQATLSQVVARMLDRGTSKHDYKAFHNELERLRSQFMVMAGGQSAHVFITTRKAELPEVLALAAEALKEPAFVPAELEAVRNMRLAELEKNKAEPTALGQVALGKALTPVPPTHPAYVRAVEEEQADLKGITVEKLKAFHQRFYGLQAGQLAVVGDFDEKEIAAALEKNFGTFSSKEKYVRVTDPFVATAPAHKEIVTPDKENAYVGVGTTLNLRDTSPDYPALELATTILGGGADARFYQEVREKRGLSYGVYAGFHAQPDADRAVFMGMASTAPQNGDAAEAVIKSLLENWSTFPDAEVEAQKVGLLHQRAQGRTDDMSVANMLAEQAELGRTMEWEQKLDEALKGLKAQDLSQAVKKNFDVSKLVWVRAGAPSKTPSPVR